MTVARPAIAQAIFAATLLVASACAAADLEAGKGGDLGELVLAEVSEVSVPERIQVGEALPIIVRGTHPDGCTTFERFETERSGERIALTAWAYRPLGPCATPGAPFEAQTTLTGLEAGVYEIRVNDTLRTTVVVAGAGAGAPRCPEAPPVTVDSVTLPPPTYAGGQAEVVVHGHLLSWCDRLLEPQVLRSGSRVLVALVAEGCGAQGNDPALCPPGPQPFVQRVSLPFETPGIFTVEVDGVAFGSIEVLNRTECRFDPLPGLTLRAPARVEAGTAFKIEVEGRLDTTCAAPELIVPEVTAGEVRLAARVHACGGGCVSLPAPATARVEVPVSGLDEGRWALVETGSGQSLNLDVLPAGSCAPVPLPDGSVEQVLLTTGLVESDGAAFQAVDVSVYGTLPAGCWSAPSLTGGVEGSRIVLSTVSTRCAATCTQAPARFVASMALAGGLAPGTYEVVVDGSAFSPFTVR